MSLVYEVVKDELQQLIEKDTKKALRKLAANCAEKRDFKAMIAERDNIKMLYTQALKKIFEEMDEQMAWMGVLTYSGHRNEE